MATSVILPASDGNTGWAAQPTSTPPVYYDKIDEPCITQAPDYTDYMWSAMIEAMQQINFAVPAERDIGSVSNVRVYFPYLGALGQSSDQRLKIEVFANGVSKGSTIRDSNTAWAQVLGYVDIPVTDFSQTEADAVRVEFTHYANYGGQYPPPDVYTIT